MLTFEKVLEIFEDYLAQDMELEVYKSRYGYVCVSFNGSPPDPPYCEGDVCRTPEELFDHLLVEYESFASIQLTKGRREENEADEQNGLILLVIAFLISPFGLPKLAFWLLGKVQDLKFAIQDLVYG